MVPRNHLLALIIILIEQADMDAQFQEGTNDTNYPIDQFICSLSFQKYVSSSPNIQKTRKATRIALYTKLSLQISCLPDEEQTGEKIVLSIK